MRQNKPRSDRKRVFKKMTEKTSWGGVARWYDQSVESKESYHQSLIVPNLLRLVALQKGERILDVACGQGILSRELAKAGAKVTGTDISPELIEIAKERSRGSDINYFVAAADNQKNVADGNFDKAVCVLALQDMEDIGGALKEISRALKQGGLFVLVINHPAFRIPKRSAWGFDDAKKTQFRRVDEYMSESRSKIEVHPGSASSPQAGSAPSTGSGQGGSPQAGSTHSTSSGQAGSAGSPQGLHTTYFHRPLQSYFKAFEKAGLAVTRLEEWVSNKVSELGPRAAIENKARREFPLFMAMVTKKI